MNTADLINQLQQFREQIYNSFSQRQDSLMDLLDALCANETAHSVVELSLHPVFRRGYSALYKAIGALDGIREQGAASESTPDQTRQGRFPQSWIEAIAPTIPAPQQRGYWLFGVDVTPVARCHAVTLKDRESVYQPTVVAGQKPITLGHNYSMLSALPEVAVAGGRSWIVPVSVERVTSFDSKSTVGQTQVQRLLNNPTLPWHSDLCVLVADSDYSHRRFLYPLSPLTKRVIVTRCRTNRVFYRLPKEHADKRRGHPQWYGERFDLKDETTWTPPDQQTIFTTTTANGHARRITLRLWQNLLMKGTKTQPMHRHPFDLLQVQVSDPTGTRAFQPQWLLVFGHARQQLSPQDAYESYVERFKLEHGIRFAKQHLLMPHLQTPEVTQEEIWVQFSWLAYVQLWVARLLAHLLPQPWQRSLPAYKQQQISPSMVQRDFARIIRQIGTPAAAVKPRGKSPGRPLGTSLAPRPRRPIIKRSRARPQKETKAA